jgi:4-hydroxybenzoate polyprenyltransferase
LAFSWGALMGWAAEFASLSLAPVALYVGAIAWTIGYDTIYAHQDKEDDALIGVRSTARLFGERTRQWLVGLYGLTVVLMALSFWLAGVGILAWLGLAAAALMFAWQIRTLDIDDPVQCLALFKFNHVVGFAIFLALVLALFFA